MAGTVGITGAVTSWAGTFNAALLAKHSPAQFSLNLDGTDLDTTAFATSGVVVETHLPGLRGWDGSWEGFTSTPTMGYLGKLTGAAYSTNIRSFSIVASARVEDVTGFNHYQSHRQYLPGIIMWAGEYEAIVDGTTALSQLDTSTQAATFQITTSNTWAGSIFTTRIGAVVNVGGVNTARYSFRGTGGITVTGTNAGAPASSSSITDAIPVTGSLVLTAASGRTFTGDAFWKRISIESGVGTSNKVKVDFQGAGSNTNPPTSAGVLVIA